MANNLFPPKPVWPAARTVGSETFLTSTNNVGINEKDVNKRYAKPSFRLIPEKNSYTTPDYLKLGVFEFSAAFVYYFIVYILGTQLNMALIDPLTFGLAQALLISSLTATFWHLGAGYINPSVSFVAFAAGKLTLQLFFVTLAAQLVASSVAAATIMGFVGPATFYGAPQIHPSANWQSALAYEFIGTMFFSSMAVWLLSSNLLFKEARPTQHDLPPPDYYHDKDKPTGVDVYHYNPALMIGLAYFCITLPGTFYSGGSLNLFRWTWPAAYSSTFDGFGVLVYWVGPLAGCLAAMFVIWAFNSLYRKAYKWDS